MSKINFFKRYGLLAFLFFAVFSCKNREDNFKIDLQGEWQFQLDQANRGLEEGYDALPSFSEIIQLPGTTDTNKKGIFNEDSTETFRLSRKYKYVGKAWYKKEIDIPQSWQDKYITLTLERTKPTQLWVDGKWVGKNNDISTSQVYELTKFLKPGKHTLTLLIDNGGGVPEQVINSSHAYSEDTQTNWNGVIGELFLEAKNKVHIQKVKVTPDIANNSAKVQIDINRPDQLEQGQQLILEANAFNSDNKDKVQQMVVDLETGKGQYAIDYNMGKDPLLWSEFDPVLYALSVQLKGGDKKEVDFGMRDFGVEGTQFTINGDKIFLRGKHDAALFPITGHIPMDLESWKAYFNTLKEYGMNYVRFHSWTPPETAFKAADRVGFYLQPELPIWGSLKKDNPKLNDFLEKEGVNTVGEFANHPSFVMFALGNEMSGEVEVMKALVSAFRKEDNRPLYSYGSNNFLGYRGQIKGEDFLTTCRIGAGDNYETDVRASFSFVDEYQGGIINNTYPNSKRDFSEAISLATVPVISHETGQYQMYPDYKQIDKYTGVLRPINFEIFRNRLEEAGMLDQAEDFFEASGKWAALLYKADIEMELRTPDIGGYQLLDLQDFSGQGTALVGILDAFMENKGIISAEKWREFNSDVVPLFLTEKFTWTNNEELEGEVKIANYSTAELKGKNINWQVEDNEGRLIEHGILPITSNRRGVLKIGEIALSLKSFDEPVKLLMKLNIKGTSYKNELALWVYPDNVVNKDDYQNIHFSKTLDQETLKRLKMGEDVLFFPDKELYKKQTVGGLFQTDYWNYGMFRRISENAGEEVSPGTLGILTDPELPLFEDFPTENHTNWQWYPILKKSYPLIMDSMEIGYKPLVQVIDNVERNHKLGLVFEFKVGKGKLLVCMADLEAVQDKPEVRQFYKSVLEYMDSDQFHPKYELDIESLEHLFNGTIKENEIKGERNVSY